METVGFVGVGKIGMPISVNLIKSGYRVVGYRRSSLSRFRRSSAACRHARSLKSARRPTSFFPPCRLTRLSKKVVQGSEGFSRIRRGPVRSWSNWARIRFQSRAKQIEPLAQKGAFFIDGEVAGTPGMVAGA